MHRRLHLARPVEAGPRRWRARRVFALAAALLALPMTALGGAAAGAQRAPRSSSTVVIGIDAELTGAFSALGVAADGTEAYIDMLNSHGGLLGHHVKAVVLDNQSTASVSASVTRELIQQDDATFVLGAESGADAAAAVPVANAFHTVMLVWDGSGWPINGMSQDQTDAYAFPGTYPLASVYTNTIVHGVIVPNHYKRVGLIEDSTPFGLLYQQALEADAKEYHFSVVSTQIFQAGSTNADSQALNILSAKPQIIINGATSGLDTITALKSIRAESSSVPIGVCIDCTIPSFTAAMGGPGPMQHVYADSTVPQLATALRSSKQNATTIKDIKNYIGAMHSAGFGTPEDLAAGESGWMSMEQLATAVEATKSLNENRVKSALAHQKIDVLGIYWDRRPGDYGAFNEAKSLTGVEITLPNGTYKPYVAKS